MQTLYLLLLAGGLLVFASVLVGAVSSRIGLPYLLVFLVAGMLVGVDGPGGLDFDNPGIAAWVGNVALAVVLLEGGISTRMETFRKGLRPALALASVGVLLTASIVGAVAMAALDVDWRLGLLLGAIVGSTDAAAVFMVLRESGLQIGERVAATLEIESGMNDPMAVFLTLAMIATIQSHAGVAEVAMLLARQAGFGAAIGVAGAAVVAWLLRRLTLKTEHGGVASLVIVSGGLAVFGACGLVEGSGFLAIYLYGLRLRERAEQAVHAASSALDGFAWAAQAAMFLLLGLLVTPHRLLERPLATLAVAATLMFLARPLAVWLCLAAMRFSGAERLFIGWVGLRGAVPIVLALFPLMQHVPDSYRFFNVAFAVVLASLLLQATTLPWAARKLGVVLPTPEPLADRHAVMGQLMLDADLPVGDVFGFFQLPVPENAGTTLHDWLTDNLARDPKAGDGIEWHGAHFHVGTLHEGRIARVRLSLRPRTVSAS